jgi:hypothetical protein
MAAYEKQGESDEWYTPRYFFDALGVSFDLDVACPPEGPRHVPADSFYFERSLERVWRGFVWMNPPFGHQETKKRWLDKFFDHGNGIALFPDRTSAPWWQEYAPRADAIMFVAPKVFFERPDGTLGTQPGTGTTLLAAGATGRDALHHASTVTVSPITAKGPTPQVGLGKVFQPLRRDAA